MSCRVLCSGQKVINSQYCKIKTQRANWLWHEQSSCIFKSNNNYWRGRLREPMIHKSFCDNDYVFTEPGVWWRTGISWAQRQSKIRFSSLQFYCQPNLKTWEPLGMGGLLEGIWMSLKQASTCFSFLYICRKWERCEGQTVSAISQVSLLALFFPFISATLTETCEDIFWSRCVITIWV